MSLATTYARVLEEVFGVPATYDADGNVVPEPPPEPLRVARGDSLLDEGDEGTLPSPLDHVDDAAWTQFVRGMATEPVSAVSPSNDVGMFQMKARRLADLGIVDAPQRTRSGAGKTIWVARFVAPLTAQRFLRDPRIQYAIFSRSCRDYAQRMAAGEIARDPEMSQSGALAILQRCGPSGLQTWAAGDRFPATERVYARVAGIF